MGIVSSHGETNTHPHHLSVQLRSLPLTLATMALLLLHTALPTAAQHKDYANGFEALLDFGLIGITTNATYVKLQLHNTDIGGSYQRGLNEISMKGNAWMLKEDKQAKSIFVLNRLHTVEAYHQDALARERKQMEEMGKEEPQHDTTVVRGKAQDEKDADDRIGGEWSTADPKEDLKKILQFMRNKLQKPDEYEWELTSGGYGTLLLSAAHFHMAGHKNEANILANMLFSHSSDRKMVVLQAVNLLADTRYNAIYESFQQDGNWQNYHASTTSLLARTGSGWKLAPAARLLADRLATHVKIANPPPLQGEGLAEQDAALATALTRAKDYVPENNSAAQALWFIKQTAPTNGPNGDKDVHVIERIRERGIRSVPLLIALISDDYLTMMDQRVWASDHQSHYFDSNDALTEERIEQMYNTMQRPATRGEVARHMLSLVCLADDEEESDEAVSDNDELRENCNEWLAQSKGKSEQDLAKRYLEKGSYQQQYAAMQLLLKAGSKEAIQHIEEQLLGLNLPNGGLWIAGQYATARGEKAREFVEKYAAAVRKELKNEESEVFSEHGSSSDVEGTLKTMKDMASPETAEDILSAILAGRRDMTESTTVLHKKLTDKKGDEKLTIILDAAQKTDDPKLCRDLIQFCTQLFGHGYYSFAEPDDEGKDDSGPDIKTHSSTWRKLLADTRIIDSSEPAGPITTVADAAAWTIESIYDSSDPYKASSLYTSLGLRTIAVIRARVLARLEGKTGVDLPPFPSADSVSADERKKMIDRIMSAKAPDMNELIRSLSSDKILALAAEAPDNKELNKKLAPIAMLISATSGKVANEESLNVCKAMKGKRLTEQMIKDLVDIAKVMTGNGSFVQCTITRQAGLDGMVIHLREIPPDDKEFDQRIKQSGYSSFSDDPFGSGGSRQPTLTAYIRDGKISGYGTWIVPVKKDEKKPKKKGRKPKTESDDWLQDLADDSNDIITDVVATQNDSFWEAAKKYIDGEGNVCTSGGVTITGTPVIPDDKTDQ